MLADAPLLFLKIRGMELPGPRKSKIVMEVPARDKARWTKAAQKNRETLVRFISDAANAAADRRLDGDKPPDQITTT